MEAVNGGQGEVCVEWVGLETLLVMFEKKALQWQPTSRIVNTETLWRHTFPEMSCTFLPPIQPPCRLTGVGEANLFRFALAVCLRYVYSQSEVQ
jgi:hypothetical protein